MKKKILFLSFIMCLAILACAFFMPARDVYAAEVAGGEVVDEELNEDDLLGEDDLVEDNIAVPDEVYDDLMRGGYIINSGTDVTDARLYQALLEIICDYIRDTYNYRYTESTLYNTMFKNFEEITIGDYQVSSLKGLGEFKFTKLRTLNVPKNKITSVDASVFKNMPVLTTLNLACNEITSIALTHATYLSDMNLSSNKLSAIDLSNIDAVNINANLAGNNFSDMKNIVLPTRIQSIHLNLISNNLREIPQEYFDHTKLTMDLGLQGLVSESITQFTTTTPINYYKTNDPQLVTKIYKVGKLEDKLVKTLQDGDDSIINVNDLGVGEYYIIYEKNGLNAYKENDVNAGYYRTFKYKVVPSDAVLKFEYKGKTYDKFEEKVTGKVKVMFSCEEGGEVMFRVNNSDWQKGTEVWCDQGGNYTVYTKVVLDGVESAEKSVLIRTSLNVIIPDIVMLILLLLFALTLFMIVVPWVSKKWFRN